MRHGATAATSGFGGDAPVFPNMAAFRVAVFLFLKPIDFPYP
jgi:hypothetical protein